MISIKDKLREFNILFQENVSLKEKTWIKTWGGLYHYGLFLLQLKVLRLI